MKSEKEILKKMEELIKERNKQCENGDWNEINKQIILLRWVLELKIWE